MSNIDAELALSGVLHTRRQRVRSLRLPGGLRVGWTRDQGGAAIFNSALFDTNLTATIRDAKDRVIDRVPLGSGKVTNAGALALGYDFNCPGVSGAPANLFANLKYHGWGTGAGTENEKDIKLETPATWEGGANNKARKETSYLVTPSGIGTPKLVSVCKLTWPAGEAGEAAIKEWGIFTYESLEATTGSPLTAVSATSGTVTGTPLTASSGTALGETLKLLVASETSEIWGLITSNSTSGVTVPAWYKQSTGAVEEPKSNSPYKLRPVMFDHRTFPVLNLSKGNSIEFTYELEIKSGG